jgi:hypothetical protein
MKHLLAIVFTCCLAITGFAQKGKNSSVIKSDAEITWLGMDFSQLRIIGTAAQWKDAGVISGDQLRDKYVPSWNELFLSEQKKFDVAKYVDRNAVHYEIDITTKANNKKFPAKVFFDNPSDFEHLEEADIRNLVKGYDFQGKSGTGLLFFVEAMSKGKEQACAWVTFVDMKSRTVLETKRIYGSAGGFGFRNYWAKSFFNILKNISREMR